MYRKTERLFLPVLLISQIILFGVMILFAVSLTRNSSEHSKNMLSQQALNISEEHMRERVENIITYIEAERSKTFQNVSALGNTIYQNLSSSDENNLEAILQVWIPRIAAMEHGELVQLILYDKTKNEYIFCYNGEVYSDTSSSDWSEVEEYINSSPYVKEIFYENKVLYVISRQESMDISSQRQIYDIVHLSQYGEDGYVWVNEILNFNGGDEYAVRRIHPNLKDTEGQYLSTNTQDVAGNYPYLHELEKIKSDGEVFHTYFFKNKSNDIISEKASYAKFYEPFNWIIATGDPLDDVMMYSSVLEEENRVVLSSTLTNTIVILFLIFLVDIILIIFNNKKIQEKLDLETRLAQKEQLAKQADYESMTGLLRKVSGENRIRDYIENSPDKNGVLIALDLDDLKGINDTLGHKAGDEAIIGVANTIKSHFPQSDIKIRSGGDEFIVFSTMDGDNKELIEHNMDLLIRKLSSISIGENKERSIHCSAGCTRLLPEDSYETLFARADKALYHVKRTGKNNFVFYAPEMEQENFIFTNDNLFSDNILQSFSQEELVTLLKSISGFYHFVTSINISKNTYTMMKEVHHVFQKETNLTGSLNKLTDDLALFVHPSQKQLFMDIFKKEGLIRAYKHGKENFTFRFYFLNKDSYQEVECVAIFYSNPLGDICVIALARWTGNPMIEIPNISVKDIL